MNWKQLKSNFFGLKNYIKNKFRNNCKQIKMRRLSKFTCKGYRGQNQEKNNRRHSALHCLFIGGILQQPNDPDPFAISNLEMMFDPSFAVSKYLLFRFQFIWCKCRSRLPPPWPNIWCHALFCPDVPKFYWNYQECPFTVNLSIIFQLLINRKITWLDLNISKTKIMQLVSITHSFHETLIPVGLQKQWNKNVKFNYYCSLILGSFWIIWKWAEQIQWGQTGFTVLNGHVLSLALFTVTTNLWYHFF